MDKRFAIFDMDGTLVDSMRYWEQLAGEYLSRHGIRRIPPVVLEQIKPMTMEQSAALFIQTFGIPGTPQEVAAEMNAMIDEHYRRDIPLKPGVRQYLAELAARNVRMCVASATAEDLMTACLTRLGVAGYFRFLLSCETVGAGKDRPDVYLAAAERLGCAPVDAAVYEDALFAAKTAKRAGFYLVGVYDAGGADSWPELADLADECIKSF